MIFKEIEVSEEIQKAVEDMGFEELTPIQEKALPILFEGYDFIGQSQTGTGKTAAFAIPVIEKIDKKLYKPQVIILCPTRELSVQVSEEINKLTKYIKEINTIAIYGGAPIDRQISKLKKGVQIIVGTPGRTIDHIRRRTIRLNNIHTVILDEADEMLKMGFREDIETILDEVTEDRQTLLFSATMPQAIIDITHKYQNDPKIVKIKSKKITAETIKQQYCDVKPSNKDEAVSRIIDVYGPKRCIIFCNKKVIVNEVTDYLQAREYSVDKIHGDLKQDLRLNVLRKFNDGRLKTLVATDVAGRGLDIRDVDLIINYNVPEKPEHYVHRIGRSGRAGREGHSITLVSRVDKHRFNDIERFIKKKIPALKIPTLKEVTYFKTKVFIENTIDTIEKEDLTKYLELLNSFDLKGHSINDVAAALIKSNLELDNEGIHNDINEEERRSRSRNRKQKKEHSTRLDGNTGRIFINVGKKDKLSASQILGAITGECNIRGRKVGNIDIYDKYTFVDIEKNSLNKVVKGLHHKRIAGRKVTVEVANKSKR